MKETNLFQKSLNIVQWKLNFTDKFIQPLLLLFIRAYIAKVFWLSGQTKIGNVENTKMLFEWEYMPNWEANKTQSILGTDITFPVPSIELATHMSILGETLLPILLVAGLGGRFAALGLFIMTLTIELFIYPGANEHPYWMLLLAVLMIIGPGKISLDYFIRKKLL